MPKSRDYLLYMLGLDLAILNFIAKNLAVNLSETCERFGIPRDEMREKIFPLLSANYVQEQSASGDPVYSITAEGIQELGRSSHKAFAAHV